MKNKVILIIVMFFWGTSYFAGFGQTLTEDDYAELARLFDIDVQFMGDTRENYNNYQSSRSQAPFAHSRVLTLSKNTNASVDKILVIVDLSIYNQLADKIKRYAYDINYVYGCEVIMEAVTGGNHTNIKSLITSNQTNLNGAVFIGDIAAAWYEVANDYVGYAGKIDKEGYGYATWPCDLYYMDLNGIWWDFNGNGRYDAHSGNVQPEIFVGRISTADMGALLPEKEGLERYLDKNHKFWLGHTTVNKKFGLTYITDSIWSSLSSFKTDIKHLYGSSNYDQVKFGDPYLGKTDYLIRLRSNRYEFIQLAAHSYAHRITPFPGGDIYANEIFDNGTEAIGYNLYCCNACNWTDTSTNKTIGFLAGAHIYNANNSSLVVVGSAKVGSMLNFDKFYIPLGQGKTIGESLKQWWVNAYGNTHPDKVIYFHYGMTIIGDPMVNFFHCINNRCVSQITLNGFDTANTASHRYIIAENKITANNYGIPSGKHVILNAKEVILNPGFECLSGGTLEITSEGCRSNCSSADYSVQGQDDDIDIFSQEYFAVEVGDLSIGKIENGKIESKEINLHPNPNPGAFQLEANFPLSDISSLKITNLQGITVYETQQVTSNTIQLQNAAAGTHFVVVILKDGRIVTQKMVVQ